MSPLNLLESGTLCRDSHRRPIEAVLLDYRHRRLLRDHPVVVRAARVPVRRAGRLEPREGLVVPRCRQRLGEASAVLDVGFGRIVASEIEVPNMLVNLA